MNMMLTRVPTTSDLWYPKLRDLFAGSWATFRDMIEIANPTRSEARWAESVKIAMDYARYPPISYATMKNIETVATIMSFFSAFLLSFSLSARIARKLRGVLTGIGVPIISGSSCFSMIRD